MYHALCVSLFSALIFAFAAFPTWALVAPVNFNCRSAILIDMTTGEILYEQDPDLQIAPASLTKILTLYVVFDALKSGELHLWDTARVSRKAARTGGSRMGLRAGTDVTFEELIKGMAVVSGNDACVAVAEHMSGTVEAFVMRMNRKARELGMTSSVFKTPNGLPAKGQVTTARDMARLSLAYLRRFPDSLTIHSMTSYTYRDSTHRNANRLLGKCPGVDGLKTGFVCASGFNISATAKRGNTRLIAVVLGASNPSIRACETAKLLELGYQKVAPELVETSYVQLLEGRKELISPEEMSCKIQKRGGRQSAGRKTMAKATTGRVSQEVKGGKQPAEVAGKGKSRSVTAAVSPRTGQACSVARPPVTGNAVVAGTGNACSRKGAVATPQRNEKRVGVKTAGTKENANPKVAKANKKPSSVKAASPGQKQPESVGDASTRKKKTSITRADSIQKPDPQVRNLSRKREKVL